MHILNRLRFLLYFSLIGLHLAAMVALAQEDRPEILVIDLDSPVTPIMLSFIDRAVAEAEARNAEALIIRLNTPGGSVDITQRIIQTIIGSEVPVVVYIWPPGGYAASAGTFITLAGHAAAMAPNTSIGAASPISGMGQEIDEVTRSKLENMLVAEVKGLAERRGEQALDWAEQAITEAKAATANEALELGVVDFVTKDLDDLLAQLDGFTVEVSGEKVTLATQGASLEFLEATLLEEILTILTSPTIALLLISLGGLALVYEIINPGGYIGGVIGVIMLLTGFYALGQLPVNFAGLALIILAFGLFIAELFTPTFGLLTAGGLIAFILGAMILFNTSEFAYQIPLPSIIGIALTLAAIFGLGLRKAMQSMRLQPVTGQEGLVGAVGTVKTTLDPQGVVLVWGERWQASSDDGQPISSGQQVKVVEIKGFQLKVRKL